MQVQKSGDTEEEGLHGGAPSASKEAAEDAAQEPIQAANPNAPAAHLAAAQRYEARTLCVLLLPDLPLISTAQCTWWALLTVWVYSMYTICQYFPAA